MIYTDWLIQWLENYIRPSVKIRTIIMGENTKKVVGNI